MIVVTGGAGFIGGALVAGLAGAGERVVAIDRHAVAGSAAAAIRADLLDRDPAVETALREADAVFHLAARPGVRDPHPDADRLRFRDNVLATREVLRHVQPAVPLVVTSSSSVYGGSVGGRACAEDDPVRPLGGYGRSKAAVERLCARRRASGGAVTLVRPFTVAGERQRPDMALARWIEAVLGGRPIVLYGSAARARDVTDVRDVVRALRLAAERGVSGALNIGTGVAHTLAELASAVCRAAGAPAELLVRPAPADDPPTTRADTARIERLLGFRPRTDLDDLVRRQLAARAPARPHLPRVAATARRS
jgi:nucleoside-diphosphate-sugar epimerase